MPVPACLPVLLLAASAAAQTPTPEEIMAQVAANQDRAAEQRKSYVFQQRARVLLTNGSNKLKRDDTRFYVVTPTEAGVERELQNQEVIHRKDGEKLELMGLAAVESDDVDGLDKGMVDGFHEDLGGDHDSRDGINPDLFPLTTDKQAEYRFEMTGLQDYQGRAVYAIRYEPQGKNFDGSPWRGEILVDRNELQPVLVTSELAWKIPLWVRTVFGVSIRQLGFKIAYAELEDGVWFPVSYGGEFQIKALHFFRRRAVVSLLNHSFQKTSVETKLHFAQQVP
jgi:hypothetical protein